MHVNPKFGWDDEPAIRAFVAGRGFAHLCIVADGAPLLAHAPLSLAADGAPRFHLARGNPMTAHLDGAAIAASVVADDFYVSPDWYADPTDQVPTWNYRAVEIYGRARRLGEAELRDQLDTLAAAQETKLLPKKPWTNAKVSSSAMAAMLRGIAGFAIEGARFVGTAKFGQNKSVADRAGVAAAVRDVAMPQSLSVPVAPDVIRGPASSSSAGPGSWIPGRARDDDGRGPNEISL